MSREQKQQYAKSKNYSAQHHEKHPYLRAEKWISDLVFWNTPYHNQAMYEDFHQRMIAEAGKRGKA